MELGLWYYAFYTWVVQPSGSGFGASFYQYGTCVSYESYTQVDPTWKTAQAFAIITFLFGLFTLVRPVFLRALPTATAAMMDL